MSAASTTPAPAAEPTGGAPADAAGIQASAYQALQGGDYEGAISQLSGLVNRCPVAVTDPCAYAWFTYGSALRQAGDPAAAVQALEHRLQNPDQAERVQAELDAAYAALEGPGDGKGKAKGKGKGHEEDD